MVTIEIQEDKCENVDCGECVDMCPNDCLTVKP